MNNIKIHTEYITLGQLLKLLSLVSSGGEVKHFLSHNKVMINDEFDNRRGKKLYPNDRVKILDKTYKIVQNEN
ncbi:MAG: S4 domain-containing protein YaaA [Candidatus Izemoplasmatales bacterium]|uniref:S4 domain-containing protein YaaA n=1 Tax=Hujiaoplasma nucleasis TaxID=2725268 RepID=A0A7L6N2N3_9MOLU|nr:S4 domain-containing protein YaaA [Hujiaoplasma nucleasis]QLY40526.1 S4 domain-containing protein YaaA [Hujiaoplasma nucleasis]